MFTYEIYPLFHVASFCEEVLSSSDEEHLCTEKLRFNLIISQYCLRFLAGSDQICLQKKVNNVTRLLNWKN